MMEGAVALLRDIAVNGLLAKAAGPDYRSLFAGVGMMVVAGLIFVLALVFLALGAYDLLESLYGPAPAYGLIAAFFLAIALGGVLAARQKMAGPAGMLDEQAQHDDMKALIDQMLSEEMWEELYKPVQDHPKAAVATAALAGFVAGEQLRPVRQINR